MLLSLSNSVYTHVLYSIVFIHKCQVLYPIRSAKNNVNINNTNKNSNIMPTWG